MSCWTRKSSVAVNGGPELATASLTGPHDLCDSIVHVGADGLGIGHAVRSTELARPKAAARSALRAR